MLCKSDGVMDRKLPKSTQTRHKKRPPVQAHAASPASAGVAVVASSKPGEMRSACGKTTAAVIPKASASILASIADNQVSPQTFQYLARYVCQHNTPSCSAWLPFYTPLMVSPKLGGSNLPLSRASYCHQMDLVFQLHTWYQESVE